MTRKSVKFPSALRRSPWKTNLGRRESDDKSIPKSIFISTSYAERWSNLKVKFRFRSDSELVDYLLNLGESQPKPSYSPDYESDDAWCTSNERRKRGPSLRAVLRRSSRKSCSKSDFLSESIDSEELQTEDSNQSDEDNKRRKIANSNSRKVSVNEKGKILPKKQPQPQIGLKKLCDSDVEKEAKANQLDAELALLVNSVDLRKPTENENELYEFQDELFPGKGLAPGSASTDDGNSASKGSHRRWKSYHKDKRKWRQSYAAVRADEDQCLKMKSKDDGCDSFKSEKERKIFKALKKNRILTAYLDSQNKIFDSSKKESHCSTGVEDETCPKEPTVKLELEPNVVPCKRMSNMDIADGSDGSKTKEDINNTLIMEKEESFNGKENKSKLKVSPEVVFLEVGERVKLKKRKKKILQDVDETTPNIETVTDNTSDQERHHRKLRRNWKKSIINYELEEKESDEKNGDNMSDSSASALNTSCQNHNNAESSGSTKECKMAFAQNKIIENGNSKDTPQCSGFESEASEHDKCSSQAKPCPQCFLRHVQQPCPVQHPYHIIEDSINFDQWQLQCHVQVRCSVIESPRPKAGRLRKSTLGSPVSNENERNYVETSTKIDEKYQIFAEESLPAGLSLRVIDEKHGKSVIAESHIAQFSRFGPLVGSHVPEKDISDESDMRHIWEVLDGKHATYMNTEDPQKSNWLRFVRPAPERDQCNVTVTVQSNKLYFVSIVEIPKGNELLYWADDHVTSWSKKKILKSSCGGCNMHFSHPLYYRTHCAIFHDPFHSLTIRKYHCKVCGESVMGKENIMKHAADLHEGRGAYQCQYCHKFFLRLNYLEMHRTYGCSSNPHRTRPLCDFCGRYFCQPQKLKVHIKRMHSDMNEVLREFQCKSCLKILGSRAALQRHFKEVHHRDVVVSSNCDRCGKSFQNRSNLKIHMLTHSGVKPFRCQQEGCSAAFTTKQCLQFHYKKAHKLSEDALPRIERSIAYTFDAYAGETTDSSSRDKEQVRRPQRVFRKSRKSSSKTQKNLSHSAHEKHLDEMSEPPTSMSSRTQISSKPIQCSESAQVNPTIEDNIYSTVTETATVSDSSFSQKIVESGTINGNTLSPSSIVMHLPYSDEDRQLGDKVLTPLRTVSLHHSNESYHSPLAMSTIPHQSPSQSPQSHLGVSTAQDLQTVISFENKGHKKWLGEVIEVAEEAAAAAMGISPCLSPHLKRDIYDFDENKVKSKVQYLDNGGRQELDVGVGRSKTASALAPFHHPESASMLVEAALDAAERDICCPDMASKTLRTRSHSPEPHPLASSYCTRSPHLKETSNPSFYTSEAASAPKNDPYLVNHSTSPHSHLHPMDSYSLPPSLSPSRMYGVPSQQVHQLQLLPQETPSSDEESGLDAACSSRGEHAQNLSLHVKEKARERSNSPSIYSAHPQHLDLAIRPPAYQEHVTLPQQNDLSFSGAMVLSSPRYHLYDLSPDRQRSEVGTDLSINNRGMPQDYNSFEDMGGSVDLSVPRGHGTDGHSLPSDFANVSHQYSPHCVPNYPAHPTAYSSSPLQRPHISSSSDSPSASPSPGPAHYQPYPAYY